MSISFDTIKNYYITRSDNISLRFPVIPTKIENDSFLLGAASEGYNLADEIYTQIKDLPDNLTEETEIADCIISYPVYDTESSGDTGTQIFIIFSPSDPGLTVMNPITHEKKKYPISFAEFRNAFVNFYGSESCKVPEN